MKREFGEKSFKPSKFEFVTIFSGQFNREYRNLFNRKLPGNILLSAYYTPMTIRELSVELGVASAYMEDEVALLEKYGLMTPLAGGKYQTNLVIFTENYTREFYKSVSECCANDVGSILAGVKELLPQIRAIGFRGNSLTDNRLMWAFLWFVMHRGHSRFEEMKSDAIPDKIYDGATGINYGADYDATGFDTPLNELNISEYGCDAFAGYSGLDDKYFASFADFGVLPEKNRYATHADIVKSALYSDENLYAVFAEKQRNEINTSLNQQIEKMAHLYEKLTDSAIKLMKVHAPKNVSALIEKIVTKTVFFRTVGLIGKCAVDSGELTLPSDDKPIALMIYETTQKDKHSVNQDCWV